MKAGGLAVVGKVVVGIAAPMLLAGGCATNVGTADSTADRPLTGAERAGLYIGDALCSWSETYADGSGEQGQYYLSLEFIVDAQGRVLLDGELLTVGGTQDATFGDTTQRVTITGVDSSLDGITWLADFTSSSATGQFDSDVRGALRFEGSGDMTFRRTIVGNGTVSGTRFDRIEQCRGTLSR